MSRRAVPFGREEDVDVATNRGVSFRSLSKQRSKLPEVSAAGSSSISFTASRTICFSAPERSRVGINCRTFSTMANLGKEIHRRGRKGRGEEDRENENIIFSF